MTNGILLSPKFEATAHDSAGLAQIVAIYAVLGRLERRNPSRASRIGRAHGSQLVRRSRRGGGHSSAVRDGLPDKSSAPTKRLSQQENLSFGSREGREETVKSMKRKLEYIGKDKNELNEKDSMLTAELIQK